MNANYNLDDVQKALNRPRLEGLTPGDRLVQKKLGNDYRSKNNGDPVIFVRYLTEAERIAYNTPCVGGGPIHADDIVISFFVDEDDGEVVRYAVDSSRYMSLE